MRQETVLNIVVYCFASNLVSVLGVVGNVAALFILSQSNKARMKSDFYRYLIALSISDFIFGEEFSVDKMR